MEQRFSGFFIFSIHLALSDHIVNVLCHSWPVGGLASLCFTLFDAKDHDSRFP